MGDQLTTTRLRGCPIPLPTDIVSRICLFLDPIQDRNSLASLCRVSGDCYYCAAPILYGAITLNQHSWPWFIEAFSDLVGGRSVSPTDRWHPSDEHPGSDIRDHALEEWRCSRLRRNLRRAAAIRVASLPTAEQEQVLARAVLALEQRLPTTVNPDSNADQDTLTAVRRSSARVPYESMGPLPRLRELIVEGPAWAKRCLELDVPENPDLTLDDRTILGHEMLTALTVFGPQIEIFHVEYPFLGRAELEAPGRLDPTSTDGMAFWLHTIVEQLPNLRIFTLRNIWTHRFLPVPELPEAECTYGFCTTVQTRLSRSLRVRPGQSERVDQIYETLEKAGGDTATLEGSYTFENVDIITGSEEEMELGKRSGTEGIVRGHIGHWLSGPNGGNVQEQVFFVD